MAVFRSPKHMYVQLIDDEKAVTLAAVSSLDKGQAAASRLNMEAARQLGARLAETAKEKGITRVVFDRGGFKYDGRIKGLAEAAREGGLQF
jgi:large subunit ribosomal protein L18